MSLYSASYRVVLCYDKRSIVRFWRSTYIQLLGPKSNVRTDKTGIRGERNIPRGGI